MLRNVTYINNDQVILATASSEVVTCMVLLCQWNKKNWKRGISVCDRVWQRIDGVNDREGWTEREGGETGRWVSSWPICMLATELTWRSHIGDTLTPSTFSLSPDTRTQTPQSHTDRHSIRDGRRLVVSQSTDVSLLVYVNIAFVCQSSVFIRVILSAVGRILRQPLQRIQST